MISLDSIVHSVKKCKSKPLVLPLQDSEFTQKTAYQLRKNQLLNMVNLINHDFNHQVDYSMHKEFENLQYNTVNEKEKDLGQNINNQSLIMINENGTCNLPETITNIIATYNKEQVIIGGNQLNLNDYYLYGLKNPESFCKALLLLYDTSFIIQKSHMRRNYVLTFKKEMAIKLDHYYKSLKYKNFKINKTELVQNIMNQDNYTNYDFYLFVADYCKINLAILDIINYKYQYISYQDNNLLPDNSLKDDTKMFIIVKYTNNIFLPIMNSNGHHHFDTEVLDIIKTQFELDNHKFTNRTQTDMFSVEEQLTNDNNTEDTTISNIGNLGIDVFTNNVDSIDTSGTSATNDTDIDSNTNQNKLHRIIKPITKYLLPELKTIAQELDINIKNNNKNKTKKELYDEIKLKMSN